MSGINKVILLGRAGKDPETRYTADGKAVTNLSLATSYGKGDSEKTEWHRCTAWEKTAEVIAEYVRKGNRLYVEGELQTKKWKDKDGQDRYTTEVKVFKVELIDRNDNSAQQTETLPKVSGSIEDMDNDIPF